ncbi:MAG: hypothetical protein D6722_02490 [Bacteroidetes bacterium]|nr:MAG: hypothetical protein D6722_02490 [Bacteroidota bacterium]
MKTEISKVAEKQPEIKAFTWKVLHKIVKRLWSRRTRKLEKGRIALIPLIFRQFPSEFHSRLTTSGSVLPDKAIHQ